MDSKHSAGKLHLLTVEIHRIYGHFFDLEPSERLAVSNSFLNTILTAVSSVGGFVDRFSGSQAQIIFEGESRRIIPQIMKLRGDLCRWIESHLGSEEWKVGMGLHRVPAPSGSAWSLCSQIAHWSQITDSTLLLSEAVTQPLGATDLFSLHWVGKVTLPDGRSFEVYEPRPKQEASTMFSKQVKPKT